MTSPSRPRWLLEALDVVERRAVLLRMVVLAVVVAGAVTAWLAPDLVPPRAVVGGAVAVGALLLGLAVVTAVDAGDPIVRGPRHVRAAGGELVGVLPSTVTVEAVDELARSVLDARPSRRLTLGVAGAQPNLPAGPWAGALGTAVARAGTSVLVVDLATGATPQDGILEVLRDGQKLGRTVELDPELKLARIGAGRDIDAAMAHASELPDRLPRDLEVLLVALPPVRGGDVLAAARGLDAVLLLARTDLTRQARLQASLEAVETVGTAAQVVLIDDRIAAAARPPADRAEPLEPRQPDDLGDGADEGDGHGSAAAEGTTALDAPVASGTLDAERGPDGTPEPDDGGGPPPPADDRTIDPGVPTQDPDVEPETRPTPDVPVTQPPADAAPSIDLGAPPGPSVRLVRDLPPTRPRPRDAGGTSEGTSTSLSEAPTPDVGPDPDVASDAPTERDVAPDPDRDVEPEASVDTDLAEGETPVTSPIREAPAVAEPLDGTGGDPAPAVTEAPAADRGPDADIGDDQEDEVPPTASVPATTPTPEGAGGAPVAESLLGRTAAPSSAGGRQDAEPAHRDSDSDGDALVEPRDREQLADLHQVAGVTVLRQELSPPADPGTPAPMDVDGPEDTANEPEDTADGPDAAGAAPDASEDVEDADEPFEGVDTERVVTETTGELPRTERSDPADDPLRTTAQFATLLDQLEERDDDGDSTSS